MKLFKFVFSLKENSYELWETDHNGDWQSCLTYYVLGKDGGPLKDKNDSGMITEMVLWKMDSLVALGYKFIGVEFSEEDGCCLDSFEK